MNLNRKCLCERKGGRTNRSVEKGQIFSVFHEFDREAKADWRSCWQAAKTGSVSVGVEWKETTTTSEQQHKTLETFCSKKRDFLPIPFRFPPLLAPDWERSDYTVTQSAAKNILTFSPTQSCDETVRIFQPRSVQCTDGKSLFLSLFGVSVIQSEWKLDSESFRFDCQISPPGKLNFRTHLKKVVKFVSSFTFICPGGGWMEWKRC